MSAEFHTSEVLAEFIPNRCQACYVANTRSVHDNGSKGRKGPPRENSTKEEPIDEMKSECLESLEFESLRLHWDIAISHHATDKEIDEVGRMLEDACEGVDTSRPLRFVMVPPFKAP